MQGKYSKWYNFKNKPYKYFSDSLQNKELVYQDPLNAPESVEGEFD
jgi:hypothetical protein